VLLRAQALQGATGAGRQAEHVLVISCWPLEEEDVMQLLTQPNSFTDVLLA
jgi:hypothetical protein